MTRATSRGPRPSRREFLGLLGLGLAGGVVAACSEPAPSAPANATSSAPPGVSPTTAPATATSRVGGTLTVAQINDPGYMVLNAVGIDTYNVTQHIFDSLYRYDGSGTLVPGLAEAWTTSPDGLVWTFKLRQGVKFHNGEDFTSEAVKYSIEANKNSPAAGRRVFFAAVKEVRAPGPTTVEVVTERPSPSLPVYLAQVLDVYPPKLMQQVGADELNKQPVGTGAYRLVEWSRDQRVVLEANPGYWGGRPKFDRLIFRFIPEPSTRVAELLAGNVDIINFLPIAQIPQVESSGTASAPSSTGTIHTYIVLRTDTPPTEDKRVRQALNYAVDVDAIIKQLYAGRATRLATCVGPSALGYDPELKPYPYDPNKAKQLLAEAGYASGVSLKVDLGLAADAKQLAEAVTGFWKKVGIEAEIVQMEPSAYVQAETGHKIDQAGLTAWSGPLFDADAIFTPKIFSKVPASYINNPDLDRLIQQGGGTFDQAQRLEAYKQAGRLFQEEAGWVFLFVPYYNFGVSTRIAWTPRVDGNMVFLDAAPKA